MAKEKKKKKKRKKESAEEPSPKPPNGDPMQWHSTSIDEAMEFVEIRKADGTLVDPKKVEFDPDFWENFINGEEERQVSA